MSDRKQATGPRSGARLRPARLTVPWLAGGVAAVVVTALAGVALGPVAIDPVGILVELFNLVPGVNIPSGLSAQDVAIVTQLRLPRVALGLLVGAVLGVSGASYQGVFRNPLADPYLLGVAAGAGLGATSAVVIGVTNSVQGGATGSGLLAAFAFAGALVAVLLTYSMGMAGERVRTPSALILAGVAVTAFLAAIQTYMLQRNVETIREVYTWILGSLATTGWSETLLLLPYAVIAITVAVAMRRRLDILAVGDDEATSLGLDPRRSRYLLIGAASLGTAAAVSVSGLIGFVGIIVPHAIRLLAGSSYRAIVPLSALFGAAFLGLSDLAARTVLTPTEVPIGIVTAFLGAPFFVAILRTARRVGL